jgi:hypothetical protein
MPKALALEIGYFDVIRNPGDEFEVPEGTTSNRWMLVDGKPFVDASGKVYDRVLDNEVSLPGVLESKKPSLAESNEPAARKGSGRVI